MYAIVLAKPKSFRILTSCEMAWKTLPAKRTRRSNNDPRSATNLSDKTNLTYPILVYQILDLPNAGEESI